VSLALVVRSPNAAFLISGWVCEANFGAKRDRLAIRGKSNMAQVHCLSTRGVMLDQCRADVDDLTEVMPGPEDWRNWALRASDELGQEILVMPRSRRFGMNYLEIFSVPIDLSSTTCGGQVQSGVQSIGISSVL